MSLPEPAPESRINPSKPGEDPAPFFSILIVNFNGIAHLQECLESIYGQTYTDYEVVIVDNGSNDGSLEFISQNFPRVKCISSDRNLGFAGGNNLGLKHCQGEFIFCLNNDTKLVQDSLSELASGIKQWPDVRVFACMLVNYFQPDTVDSAGDTIYTNGLPFSFQGFPTRFFTQERFVTSACAGAAAYARPLLESLGGFDEDFFLMFEDVDLSLRLQHLGEKILFLPRAKVFHKSSASMGGKRSPTSFYFAERNFAWFMLKNYPAPALARILPKFLLLKAWRFVHAVRFGFGMVYIRANLDSAGKFPVMWRKRKAILKNSVLDYSRFQSLLRPHWLRERISIIRKNLDIPI